MNRNRLGRPTMTARKTTTPKPAPAPTEAPTDEGTDEGTEFLRQFRAGASSGEPFLAEVDGIWYSIAVTDDPGH
jgi:hypothetical protein